jgi:hypothetical protein
VRFWFTPVDPIGLHVVRILAGLLFLTWLLPLAGQVDSLFGLQGWFDPRAYAEAVRIPETGVDQIGWTLLYVVGANSTLLATFYWASIAVIALFTLGLWTRVTGVLTWVAVASFMTNPASGFDADALLGILAFYLMVGYLLLGQSQPRQSLASRLFGSTSTWLLGRSAGAQPSHAANAALRLLQVHFAIVLVVSGLHKLQYGDWWAGLAFWYPLYPPLTTTLAEAKEHFEMREWYLSWLNVITYGILAWEIAFPVFAWRRRWRAVLIGGAALGWLGDALIYGVPLFGPAIFIATLSFVTAEEWHRLFTWLGGLPGLGWLDSWVPAAANEVSEPRETKKVEAESLVPVGQD